MSLFHVRIFQEMQAFLQQAQLASGTYTTRAQDFTRERKLPFTRTFLLVLSLLKKAYK